MKKLIYIFCRYQCWVGCEKSMRLPKGKQVLQRKLMKATIICQKIFLPDKAFGKITKITDIVVTNIISTKILLVFFAFSQYF